MAKNKPKIPSIREISGQLKNKTFLPVYYLFGEDTGTIDGALDAIKKSVAPLITSDFDVETISADNASKMEDVIDLASAFPFGDGKKLIIVKNADNIKDKKSLAGYLDNAPDFTYLVLAHYANITGFEKEPFPALIKHEAIFESKNLRGIELENWLMKRAASHGKKLFQTEAGALIELAGEERTFLETQLDKLINFIGDRDEITLDDIKSAASTGKEYNVFKLLEYLGKGDKRAFLETADGLLDSGEEILKILGMITKYLTVIAHATELKKVGMPDKEASKEIGVNFYYYQNCIKFRYFFMKENLHRAAKAVLDAELALKTSAVDDKTVMAVLVSTMIK